jgi:hypothetical protein
MINRHHLTDLRQIGFADEVELVLFLVCSGSAGRKIARTAGLAIYTIWPRTRNPPP